jgi:general secretion pathway protein G
MRRRRSVERRIFFPWEGRGGLRRWLGLGRFRPVALALLAVGLVAIVGVRERRRAGVRQTRATLLGARAAVESYMLDHDGGCPPSLEAVAEHVGAEQIARDAWGRPLRLACPGRREGEPYELTSDGPDRVPGGLDRIQ